MDRADLREGVGRMGRRGGMVVGVVVGGGGLGGEDVGRGGEG